jgi:alpha-mannosidase
MQSVAMLPRPDTGGKTINVHMIAHSHDEVGWDKTVDEYFTGYRSENSHANVELILDELVMALQENEHRMFTYGEMKFFSMWYNIQDDKKKQVVKDLIKSGRLEIAQGAWVESDEASPNYEDMILNMQKGHQFLKREFDVTPRIGWNIDAFGHSSANAALYHDFGFEALFFTRVDDRLRFDLMEKGGMSFLWEPFSKHFGEEKQILVVASSFGYLKPHRHTELSNEPREERTKEDEPFINSKEVETYNMDRKCREFVNEVLNQTKWHNAKENVAILWGDEFAF